MSLPNRLCVSVVAATVFVCSTAAAADAPATSKPNILIIVADDLGWRDVPWHGCDYEMPHLDALAKESLLLDAHYGHPMCSPTRAALLSGRYASRFGCTAAQNDRVYPFETITLAAALKSVGYTTAITGKWHLGSLPEWGPNLFGFDHSYGSLAGGVGPYDHHYKKGPYTETWHRNGGLIQEEGHVTDLIAAEAVRFIERKHAEPFFLYVPFTAVHIPIDEPEEWLAKNSHITEPGDRLHAACATHMDAAIGRILAAVERSGRRDDTLVLFFSDNGGHGPTQNFDTKYPGNYPQQKVGRDNGPLRGLKSSVWEGGVRTVALINWRGKLKPGTLDAPLAACDWMPTLTGLVGYQPPRDLRWDGINAWPTLSGAPESSEPRTVYSSGVRGRESMIRRGPWKLIVSPNGPPQLYNVVDDIGETTDRTSSEPEIVADLRRRFDEVAARDDESKVKRE